MRKYSRFTGYDKYYLSIIIKSSITHEGRILTNNHDFMLWTDISGACQFLHVALDKLFETCN